MTRRLYTLALILASSACSQRSPWVVVPSPSAKQQAEPLAPPPLAPPDATAVAHLGTLFFPVAGMDSARLSDSFDDPRDGGVRKHNAIDIMAPRGSAVLSVQDGRILRLTKNAKGGTTIYATDLDEKFVYYYAHLDRYHANIYAGRPLMRGDTIAYVGTTGNAPKDVPHLHFQVMHMPPDRKYWVGEPINPYPLLQARPTVGQ